MCALLPAWLCLVLVFLPLEIQSRAVTVQSLTHRHSVGSESPRCPARRVIRIPVRITYRIKIIRLSLPRSSKYPKYSYTTVMPAASALPVAIYNHITQEDRHIIWRARLYKEPPPRLSNLLSDQPVLQEPLAWQRGSRGRRHANSGGGRGHGHLMRVGCVLGTCQVQNLSHRLYQLIGQSGREDSSPINPRSPHSYG